MFATDYPLLDLFWTMMIVFLFIIWLSILFRVIVDIFRSGDMGGGTKALWMIFVIVLPFLGLLVYLIVRGGTMSERQMDRAWHQTSDEVAWSGGASSAEELAKLADLRDRGVITDADFQQQKDKILSS